MAHKQRGHDQNILNDGPGCRVQLIRVNHRSGKLQMAFVPHAAKIPRKGFSNLQLLECSSSFQWAEKKPKHRRVKAEGCPQTVSHICGRPHNGVLRIFQAAGSLESSLRWCSWVTDKISGIEDLLEQLWTWQPVSCPTSAWMHCQEDN